MNEISKTSAREKNTDDRKEKKEIEGKIRIKKNVIWKDISMKSEQIRK